jgi:hypothetical protein
MPRRRLTVEELRELFAGAFKGRSPTVQEMLFARILNRLPIQEGEEWRIVPAVTALIAMATAIPKTKNVDAFRPINLRQWERQRRRLIAVTKTGSVAVARKALAEQRGPMINAQAREGFIRPLKLKKAHLPVLRAAAERAVPGADVPEEQHREQSTYDLGAAYLTDLLAGIFYRVTGLYPTVRVQVKLGPAESYGPFYELVQGVFEASGIKRNANYAARAATARWRKNANLSAR